MSFPRLRERIPKSELISSACLRSHQLRFHKKGQDGSAKADALFTGNSGDTVLGALYQLSDTDLMLLDAIEDCGVGYERQEVLVSTDTEAYTAWTYVALQIDRSLMPFDWYLQHVIQGATRLELPVDYIEQLHAINHMLDTDIERVNRELSIYS